MNTKRPHSRIRLLIVCILCISFVAAFSTAAMIQGTPELEAKVVGTNELIPGTDTTLTILLSNVASPEGEQKTGINTAYNSLIAMGIKVTPHADDEVLAIKSDATMIGDIAPGGQKEIEMYATIRQDAAPGVYNLPLTLSYTYVESTVEYKFESVQMLYRSAEKEITTPITIAENVQVGLQSISTDSLNIGHEGIVTLEIENIGYGTGYNTVAHYYTADDSPLVPVDGTAFIGTFAPGQREKLTFKLKIDSGAEPKEYPGGLILEYFDSSGLSHRTDPRIFGVQAAEKLTFEIVNNQISIHPGETKTFEIEITNTGVTTAHGAQAKASVLIPFTGVHDRYSLGDLGARETVPAKFTIAVDAQAVVKAYKMDVFVRYKDDLENSRVSDAMGITVNVVKRTGLDAFLHNMELMSVCGGLIVIVLYSIFALRKDKVKK